MVELNYMKGLCVVVTAFLWSIMPLIGNPYLAVIAKKRAAGAAPTYIVEENCEGTNTPADWTDNTSPNWDYSTTGLDMEGSKCLFTGSNSTYYAFADESTVECYAMIRFTALPGSTSSVMSLRTSGGGVCSIFRVNSGGSVTIYTNAGDSTACSNTMSINTTYHVWLRHVSNGTSSVSWSTDGARPAAGSAGDPNFTSRSSNAVSAGRFQQDNFSHFADRLLLSTESIPSSP